LPWLYWAWCYAHQLELVCKDAFSSCLFHDIDEMLLRLYCLYEKSSDVNFQTLSMILRRYLNSLKVVIYLWSSRKSLNYIQVESFTASCQSTWGLP
jgi:TFIIF-interacting CTD phosphatase-like protein